MPEPARRRDGDGRRVLGADAEHRRLVGTVAAGVAGAPSGLASSGLDARREEDRRALGRQADRRAAGQRRRAADGDARRIAGGRDGHRARDLEASALSRARAQAHARAARVGCGPLARLRGVSPDSDPERVARRRERDVDQHALAHVGERSASVAGDGGAPARRQIEQHDAVALVGGDREQLAVGRQVGGDDVRVARCSAGSARGALRAGRSGDDVSSSITSFSRTTASTGARAGRGQRQNVGSVAEVQLVDDLRPARRAATRRRARVERAASAR